MNSQTTIARIAKGTTCDHMKASDSSYRRAFRGRHGQANNGTTGMGMSGCQAQSRLRLPGEEAVMPRFSLWFETTGKR